MRCRRVNSQSAIYLKQLPVFSVKLEIYFLPLRTHSESCNLFKRVFDEYCVSRLAPSPGHETMSISVGDKVLCGFDMQSFSTTCSVLVSIAAAFLANSRFAAETSFCNQLNNVFRAIYVHMQKIWLAFFKSS